MKKNKLIIISILILVMIGVGAYKYLFENKFLDEAKNKDFLRMTSSSSRFEDISSKIETKESAENTKEYKNKIRGFSLKYPSDLSVKEYNEGHDSYSVVFEDKAGAKSFQIFFTPYFGNEITQSRILKDVSSGKFTKPIEIVIGGGIPALAFTSESNLGQMREVWFIRNNYLYEATTYLNLDSWLAEIMKTWSFESF